MQPSYAHVMPEEPGNLGWYGKMIHGLGTIFGGCGSIPFCFCCPNPYHRGTVIYARQLFNTTVFEGQTGLVLKFGKYGRAVDPGLTKVNP